MMTEERYAELRAQVEKDWGAPAGSLEGFYASCLSEALDEIDRLRSEIASERADREAEAIARAEHEE